MLETVILCLRLVEVVDGFLIKPLIGGIERGDGHDYDLEFADGAMFTEGLDHDG